MSMKTEKLARAIVAVELTKLAVNPASTVASSKTTSNIPPRGQAAVVGGLTGASVRARPGVKDETILASGAKEVV